MQSILHKTYLLSGFIGYWFADSCCIICSRPRERIELWLKMWIEKAVFSVWLSFHYPIMKHLIKVFSFSWGPPLKQEDEWQSPRSVVKTNWDATSKRFRVVPSIKIITAVALAMTSWTELQKTSLIWHYHPCKDFWKVSPSCARGLSSYFQWQVMGGGKWQLKSSHFPPFSCSIPKLWLWNLRASVNECRTQSTQMFRLQIIWSLSLSVSWFSYLALASLYFQVTKSIPFCWFCSTQKS